MKITDRHKTYDVLINKLYEQSEPNGLLLQDILKRGRINRSHYLSLVWQIPSQIVNELNEIYDINKVLLSWHKSTYYVQNKNRHLTIASFDKISESYNSARYLTYGNGLNDKVKNTISRWNGFEIKLSEATIGASGINIEIDVDSYNEEKIKKYLTELEKIPGLDVPKKMERWSISLVRYLRTTGIYFPIHENQLRNLFNESNVAYNKIVTVRPEQLKLVLIDKVAESFEII